MHYHRHIHLILVLVAMLLLLAVRPARAQQRFVVKYDTVSLNGISPASGLSVSCSLGQIRKYRDYYFGIYTEQKRFGLSEKTLLAISIRDGISRPIEYPEDIEDNWSYGLFVRNDVLYLGSSSDNKSYCFDYDNWQWRRAPYVSVYWYEDENYYVVPRYKGGSDMLFVEKNTTWYPETKNGWLQMEPVNRPYLNHFGRSRIIKGASQYYFIRNNGRIDSLPLNRPGEIGYMDVLGDVFGCETKNSFSPREKWVFESDMDLSLRRLYYSYGSCRIGYREPIQDYICRTAFCVNNQLYLVVSGRDKTFIAQMVNGEIREIEPLIYGFRHFRDLSGEWFFNSVPNSCHLEFTEEHSTVSVDVEDTNVYIRYFTFDCHPDSLPIASEKSTEHILDFLLKNLPDIPLSNVDSCERNWGGLGLSRFSSLNNGFFPARYQNPNKYGKLSYYKFYNDGWRSEFEYCVQKRDSMVKAVFIDWFPAKYEYRTWGMESSAKCKEVKDIVSRITGVQPQQEKFFLKWEYNNLVIELYDNTRMVIY